MLYSKIGGNVILKFNIYLYDSDQYNKEMKPKNKRKYPINMFGHFGSKLKYNPKPYLLDAIIILWELMNMNEYYKGCNIIIYSKDPEKIVTIKYDDKT